MEVQSLTKPVQVKGIIEDMGTWLKMYQGTVIRSPSCAEEHRALVSSGMQKRLVIMYRPLAGGKLRFYDQNLVRIRDVISMCNAEVVYFTNQKPEIVDIIADIKALDGAILFDQTVTVKGRLSLQWRLTLAYPGEAYTFTDEY